MASPTAVDPASAARADESDLDPAAFLKSVRELSEKREREDAERYRKLEEDIERSKQERAARRAERARSISPQKARTPAPASTLRSSPNVISGGTPPLPVTPSTSSAYTMDSNAGEPPASTASEVPEFQGFRSSSKSKSSTPATQSPAPGSVASESASKPSPSATSLARSGTLSWQQRPSSRGAGSRPQSMVISSTSASTKSVAAEETEPSRDQIAASLGARDPSWFKQTADRGIGNAAFRKNQDEAGPADSFVSGRRGLPGMSRQPAPEFGGGDTQPSASASVESLSRTGSAASNTVFRSSSSATSVSTSAKPDLKALIAEDESQAKASPMSEQTSSSATDRSQSSLSRTPTMSSSQARIANVPDRPSSPTKGMGGFVQSAMMKRSDSITKRWSAQPSAGLSRGDSISGARSGYTGLAGSHSMPRMEPSASSKDVNDDPTLKLSSSSNNLTGSASTYKQESSGFVKPSVPSHGRSESVASDRNTTAEDGHTSPPASPAKRWSPSKSTWLESAITKPESPKPNLARNSQPSWMADIAKAKAQRANAEGSSKPAEDTGSRPGSPTKELFGQSILKRPESRDLGTPAASISKPLEPEITRSPSPTKSLASKPLEQEVVRSPSPSKSLTSKPLEQEIVRSPSPSKNLSGLDDLKRTESPALAPSTLPTTKPVESSLAQAVVKESSQPTTQMETTRDVKPSTSTITAKTKPETPPKPQTDFRSNLRPRPQAETKAEEQPEFLSKFGNLRKTQRQNYVAPDILKDNILRGKSDLSKTGGPVKTERRDELKESLLAKKDQWKKDKDEGIVHERKVSQPPSTPQKPEALAKREVLGKTETIKAPVVPEKPKTATPEALARHKSLKEKPQVDPALPALSKQTSAPAKTPTETAAVMSTKQSSMPLPAPAETVSKQTETSKLAARFNPGLANVLARGPAPVRTPTDENQRSESPGIIQRSTTPRSAAPSEPSAEGGQLQDMRKGRAKGPKKRKGAVKEVETEPASSTPPEPASRAVAVDSTPLVDTAEPTTQDAFESEPVPKAKPRALPGSAASLMVASLSKPSASPQPATENDKPTPGFKSAAIATSTPSRVKQFTPMQSPAEPTAKAVQEKPVAPVKSPAIATAKPSDEISMAPAKPSDDKPVAPAKKPALGWNDDPSTDRSAPSTPVSQKPTVPEFKGFGSTKKSGLAASLDDNKENAGSAAQSVKSTISQWGKQASPTKTQSPAQIKLPSRKDEEAAMRSAGLLSSSPTRPGTSSGLGISIEKSNGPAETPPPSAGAPQKPAKPSRAVSGQLGETSAAMSETARSLLKTFGTVPKSSTPLSIDTRAVMTSSPHQERSFRTVRKSVQVVSYDGTLQELPPYEEYTFHDESVYICTHGYSVSDGLQKAEMFLWVGDSCIKGVPEQAESTAKRLARDIGNASVHVVSQGLEPPGFLQAMGGILITRRGSQQSASKQYMLRGRKHLGQIVFDEVDFRVDALSSGFAYLISYPATAQETRMYLWKGSACSPEELSAGRLAAADLGGNREVIEVDDGAEFASFLKIFGAGTAKTSIPKPTAIWQQKSVDPDRFASRLFKIQPAEAKSGIFSNLFTRRPSWGNLSPARKEENQTKLEAKEISPFTQSDLEADCVYLLDAYSAAYVLVGPLFSTQSENVRNLLFGQTLLFASDYAMLTVSTDDRPSVPKCYVLLSGVPTDLKLLFRHWDESVGLWGGSGLMTSSDVKNQDELKVLDLNEVVSVVCNNSKAE